MTLTQLSYIVAVDKLKNFGLAAESCSVTQPTLSMQIQKLEDELGVQIFDRSHQPVKPTKIGSALIAQARIILTESQHFHEIIQDSNGEVKGQVSLGVIPTLAPYLLPLFIKKFSEKHPALEINVEELQTEQILERLKNNSLDVALLVTPIEDPALDSTPLFYEPFLVYTSEHSSLYVKSKVSQADLNSNDIWLLSEGHCFRDQSLAVCKNRKKSSDVKRTIKFESGSLETLKRMVEQENGFTLLPYLAAQDVHNKKQVKEFSSPIPTREVSLIHNLHFKRNAFKESIIETIQKSLPKDISVSLTKNSQIVDLPIGKN